MKCKICGEEINITIFDMPEDVCYRCLTLEEKNQVIEKSIQEILKTNGD